MSDAPAGMFFLFLSIVAASAFVLIMKFSQERGYSVLAVGAVNYVAAAIAAAALVPPVQVSAVSSAMFLLAAASGALFVATYLLLTYALRRRGIAVPNAAIHISMVVPLVPSVVLWHESVNAAQVAGVSLAVAAVLLLAPASAMATRFSRWAYLVVPGIFLASGSIRVAQKAIAVFAPDHQQPALTLIWFGTSAVLALGLMVFTDRPTRVGEWVAGACLGCANLGGLVCLLRALSLVPAVIAFPVHSSLSILLVSVCAFLFWHERVSRRAGLGLVMGILAVVLVNLR